MATASDMIEAYTADLADADARCPAAAQSLRVLIAQLQAFPANMEVVGQVDAGYNDVLAKWDACAKGVAPTPGPGPTPVGGGGNAVLWLAGAVILYVLLR